MHNRDKVVLQIKDYEAKKEWERGRKIYYKIYIKVMPTCLIGYAENNIILITKVSQNEMHSWGW